MTELGRGIVEAGLGMLEVGLAWGSFDGRGSPVVRFGVSSMAKEVSVVAGRQIDTASRA